MEHCLIVVVRDLLKRRKQKPAAAFRAAAADAVPEGARAVRLENEQEPVVRESAFPGSGVRSVKKIDEFQIDLPAERKQSELFEMGKRHDFASFSGT